MPGAIARIKPANFVLQNGKATARLIQDIAYATNVPYLQSIAGISMMIMEVVEGIKKNKDDCLRLVERVNEFLCAIVNACHATTAQLSPTMVRFIGQFSDTLQKTLNCMRDQLEGNLMKRILRRSEHAGMIADCHSDLKHGLDMFMASVQCGVMTAATLGELQADMAGKHKELMQVLTDPKKLSQLAPGSSSSIFLLLPGSPKIFHGRDKELIQIVSSLTNEGIPARIAILGTGGVGKSALSLAALHHPEVESFFGKNRFFIPCDSATSANVLIASVAAHFNLSRDSKPLKSVARYLSSLKDPSVLVLDNLDTAWEPLEERSAVEDFLSVLADISPLRILVTMRGCERPGQVLWSQPRLPPLSTLDSIAARKTFLDISDFNEEDCDDEVDEVLSLTDNLPLAVTLVSHLVAVEGVASVLRRWKTQKTSVLSEGLDKRSNLDISITMSISSRRVVSTPGAQDLLSVIALLPDGIMLDIMDNLGLQIPDIPKCRVALCRASLTYVDSTGRIKALVPIREHVLKHSAPSIDLIRPVVAHLSDVLGPFKSYSHVFYSGVVPRASSEWGNTNSVVRYSMAHALMDSTFYHNTIELLALTTNFTLCTGIGSFDLVLSLKDSVELIPDDGLRGICYRLLSVAAHSTDHGINVEETVSKSLQCFEKVGDLASQARAHLSILYHYQMTTQYTKALETCNKSLKLAEKAGALEWQCESLRWMSTFQRLLGNYRKGIKDAQAAIAVAKRMNNIALQARYAWNECMCRATIGDYRRAYAICSDALALLAAVNHTDSSIYGVSLINLQAEILLRQTDYIAARAVQEKTAIHLRKPTQEGSNQGWAQFQSGQLWTTAHILHIDILTDNPNITLPPLEQIEYLRPFLASYKSSRLDTYIDFIICIYHTQEGSYAAAQAILDHYSVCFRTTATSHEDLCSYFELSAELAYVRGDSTSALYASVLLLAVSRQAEYIPRTHVALQFLAGVFVAEGDDETACSLFTLALEGFTFMDVHRSRADCMLGLGDISNRKGHACDAREYWNTARSLYEKCCRRRDIIRCDERLARSN